MSDDLRSTFERELNAAPPATLDPAGAVKTGRKRRLLVNGSLGLVAVVLAAVAITGGATLLSNTEPSLPPAKPGPGLSPGGAILVAGQLRGGTEAKGDTTIYGLDESGRAEHVLDASPFGAEAEPAWSPDRSMIAFSMNVKEGDPDTLDPNMELFVASEGSSLIRITHSETTDTLPALSPDGTRIAFVSDRSGNGDIYIYDIDSRNLEQVTSNPAPDAFPAWSPDGTQLLYSSNRDTIVDLYAIDLETGEERRITDNDQAEGPPSWSPDGRTILFTSSASMSVYLLEEGVDSAREVEIDPGSSSAGDGDEGNVSSRAPHVADAVWSDAGDRLAVAVLDGELGHRAGRVLIVDLEGRTLAQSPVFEMFSGLAWGP